MIPKMKAAMLIALMMLVPLGYTRIAHAQTETGQITGTVYDPTGAVIPNAKITVKSTTTGLIRDTNTTSSGTYAITNLQPGVYTVSVEASGFSPVQQTADVTVGARVGLD